MIRDDYWRTVAIDIAEELEVQKNTRLPSPVDVADALGEDWTAGSREEYRKRFSALYDLVQVKVPTESEYPDLFPETEPDHPGEPWKYLGQGYGVRVNGLPVGDWLPAADGEIDKRLSSGLQTLHLNLLADGKGFPIPTKGAQEHYHPDPNHPQQGNVHFELSTDRKDAVTAWAAWLTVLTDGFEAAHQVWERVDPNTRNAAGLKHPLAALIKGWLIDRPVPPDKRTTAIMPATLSRVRDVVDAPADLFGLADHEQAPGFAPRPELQGYLPGLAPERSELISPLPLLMWDASTEGAPRRGKGAPLALRTWIEAVLALSVDKRFVGHIVEIRWQDFTCWLMPNGRYQRSDFAPIMRALHNVHNLRLPWERNGVGGLWAAVQVRTLPRAWNAYDDPVRFEVELPPGVNDRGPLVYRPALRKLGQQSALRYRAYLGLCWLWDRNGASGGRYIQPTRPRLDRDKEDRILNAKREIIKGRDGQPVRMWTVQGKNGQRKARPGIVPLDAAGNPTALTDAAQERNPAADRYPILSPAQLVELCYSPAQEQLTPSAKRKRRFEASKAIYQMAEAGYCIVEDVDDSFRILPPYGWGAGFGG